MRRPAVSPLPTNSASPYGRKCPHLSPASPYSTGRYHGVTHLYLPFWREGVTQPHPMPPLMVRGGVTQPHSMPPLMAKKVSRALLHMPPLMVRGGVERSETEGIRVDLQKGRHLLCTFCPCEKRKQGETSGNAAREERNRQSAALLRGAPPVSVLYNLSADSRYIFSTKKCNETET